ncbi:hypothetical protein CANCADRAFT_28266 [Tortispora caseinolytica NRRL Y-17796]|uniref:Ammonium transporter n=1 Tax=Tortispora caseinolytica NRRL Y-17796 TaxID=767744 RepID=A0A1E4TD06_9ASCO|nr:hypothetical protein CANCADRAFT_28266 [Tortispora caseinolytica NRRL Y-17796]
MSAQPTIPADEWTAAGGDSHVYDINTPYLEAGVGFQYVWVMVAGALVWYIVPGLGLLYAGQGKRTSGATMLWNCLMVSSLISFQWFFWGYSLVYSHTSSSVFLGNLDAFALMNVVALPVGYLPEIVYCFYQGMFAICTVMIMIGGFFERARTVPIMLFAFCWCTVVYCPIAYWTWNANGWLASHGALDFAGGGPVHMASGFSALAIAFWLGKRIDPETKAKKVQRNKPHNSTLMFIGTCFIWFGWFGFNGGSTGNATVRAGYALVNTNLAASTGMLGYSFVEYFMKGKHFTLPGACEGVVAGLVGITPAAGFVPVYFAAIIGFLVAGICSACENLTLWIGIDEGLDVYRLHGVAGAWGAVFTGLFANNWVSLLDGSTDAQGWLNHHYVQLGWQLAEILAIFGWSIVVTSILYNLINYIPGLKFRVSEEDELAGLDYSQMGGETIGEISLDKVLETYEVSFVHGKAGATAPSGAVTPMPEEKSDAPTTEV